jgi:hypothetical protein
MTNYRSKRGIRYYFRRKIPLELQAQFGGRKGIVKALGTSDPSKADALCREHAVVYDTIFSAARQSAEAGKATARVQASLDAVQKAAIAQQGEDYDRAQLTHDEEAGVLSHQTEEQEIAQNDRFEKLVGEEIWRLMAREEARRHFRRDCSAFVEDARKGGTANPKLFSGFCDSQTKRPENVLP